MTNERKIQLSLLSLRIGVAIVMFIWTIDKFIRPSHAAAVFKKFYFIPGLSVNFSYLIGAGQALILLAFVLGFKKKWSYGAILLLHAVSTFSSFAQYMSPFTGPHILFYAAWPMLAACFALFLLRDLDTCCTIKSQNS